MKHCGDCGCSLARSEFARNRTRPDGLQNRCKLCLGLRNTAWVKANPQKRAAHAAKWYSANRGEAIATARRWAQANPQRVTERVAKREAAKLQATPTWADHDLIADLYQLAAIYTAAGIKAHVDHVVPLRSKLVCGLHTPDNLTVLPARDNIAKGNRLWPGMP